MPSSTDGTRDLMRGIGFMKIELIGYPTRSDWIEVKRRALVTIGKTPLSEPDLEWKHDILEARHSPIRYLTFSFMLTDIPYCTSVHLCRHIHAQPYVRSQRNDRQSMYDRNAARQDAPVNMIWDINAEELMVIANKRLCAQADKTTRLVVNTMCDIVLDMFPEFAGLLVPMCDYTGTCHEMFPCGRKEKNGV